VVVKPTVGALDLVTRSAEGVRNMGRQHLLQEEFFLANSRIRPPRAFGPQGELQEFNPEAATGQEVLRFVLKGAFEAECLSRYLHLVTQKTGREGSSMLRNHTQTPENCSRWLLCSHNRLVYVEEFKMEQERLGIQVLWTSPLQFISGISKLESAQAIKIQLQEPTHFTRNIKYSRETPMVFDQSEMDTITLYTLLEKTLGKLNAEKHIRGPALDSIVLQANLKKASVKVIIAVTKQRWYVISNNVLYEFSEPPSLARSEMTMCLPLTKLAVSCGPFDSYSHAIRVRAVGGQPKGMGCVKRDIDSGRLKISNLDELMLVMPSHSVMEEWALALYQNTIEVTRTHIYGDSTLEDLGPSQTTKPGKSPQAFENPTLLFLDCFHLHADTDLQKVSEELEMMIHLHTP